MNGNDSTASLNGLPYQTVNAAVSGATGGCTVWVMPGTYNLSYGVTLPTGSSIRGLSLQTTTLQILNATTTTNLVTMSTQTRLEDLTLNLTANPGSAGVNLTGVYYPLTTTTSSKLRTVVVNVGSTASSQDTGNIYGIYADGTTTNPFVVQSTNAMQRTTVNVNSTSRGRNCALYVSPTATCQFAVRDCVFFANSTLGATAVGVECGGTGSFLSIKTSSCSGTTNDIKQDTGGLTGSQSTIQLSSTDLINANSDAYGFTTNASPNQIQFVVFGQIANNTYYLSSGNVTGSSLVAAAIASIPFTSRTIVFAMTAFYSNGATGILAGDQVTINLFNTSTPNTGGSGTLVSSIILNSTTGAPASSPVRLQNFSSTYLTTNYLQMQIVSSGMNNASYNNGTLLISISLY